MTDSEMPDLDVLIERAFTGDRSAATFFFEQMLDTQLLVPERYSNPPVKKDEEVNYPHLFLNILGYLDSERVCVPAFTQADHASSFVSPAPRCRAIRGSELLTLVPDDWWIIVNPTQEVAKELSPWEIALLRQGRESIAEIVAEVFTHDTPTPLRVTTPNDDEFDNLRKALTEHCATDKRIRKLFLLQEVSLDEGLPVPLIGVIIHPVFAEDEDAVLEQVRGTANLSQIGGANPRIFIGTEDKPGMMLKLFLGSPPLYESTAEFESARWGIPFFRRAFR